MNKLFVGVVGYSAKPFNKEKAIKLLEQAFDKAFFPYTESFADVIVVSGLTDVGIPALAYREAAKRGWKTSGVACKLAENYTCYPCDEKIILGENWGDESQTFLDSFNVLVRIGGGPQSLKETAKAKEMGLKVIEYELELEK